MSRRLTAAAALITVVAVAACDSGDGRELADPAVPFTEPEATTTSVPEVRQFTRGTATLTMDDGQSFTFDLTACFVGDQPESQVSLQVDGTTTGPDGQTVTLSVVRVEPDHTNPNVIETVSVRFGGDGALPDRAWEAQRTIAPDGTVTDLHGQGSTPLLTVADTDVEVTVTAADAFYTQFGFGTVASGDVGVGDLSLTCT